MAKKSFNNLIKRILLDCYIHNDEEKTKSNFNFAIHEELNAKNLTKDEHYKILRAKEIFDELSLNEIILIHAYFARRFDKLLKANRKINISDSETLKAKLTDLDYGEYRCFNVDYGFRIKKRFELIKVFPYKGNLYCKLRLVGINGYCMPFEDDYYKVIIDENTYEYTKLLKVMDRKLMYELIDKPY